MKDQRQPAPVLPRVAAAALERAMATAPVVVLLGARQTGKTTLVRSLPVAVHAPRAPGVGARGRLGRPPEGAVCPVAGRAGRRPHAGAGTATGTAPPSPSPSPPPPEDWRNAARLGGFPVPAHELGADEARALWFSGYVQTYLERDLQTLRAVESLADFRRLMRAACLRIGALVNQTELGRDTGISQPQVHRFLNLMEASYLAIRLPAYAVNRTRRLIKAPKLMAMYVPGEQARRPIRGFFERGHPLCGAVVLQKRVHYVAFVREESYRTGELARAAYYCWNPLLFTDRTAALQGLRSFPLRLWHEDKQVA